MSASELLQLVYFVSKLVILTDLFIYLFFWFIKLVHSSVQTPENLNIWVCSLSGTILVCVAIFN